MTPTIRQAEPADDDAIWRILEPAFRAGETYPLPRDISRADALAYWRTPGHSVVVAQDLVGQDLVGQDLVGQDLVGQDSVGQDNGTIIGTYYLRANQKGGGGHVCNCGYIVAPGQTGHGVARAMCEHSLTLARERGFAAMQFNFVVASNERAVRLWQSCGFAIVGTLPGVFKHPARGLVDAYVMHRTL